MKNVLSLIVLMLTLVLSQKDVYAHKRMIELVKLRGVLSTEEALSDLTQEGKPIPEEKNYYFLSPYCKTLDMRVLEITVYGRRYDFQQTCYVVGVLSGNAIVSLHLISMDTTEETTQGSKVCANKLKFQAVILPFFMGENTYMILNPVRAP